jgi:hypothetical protein
MISSTTSTAQDQEKKLRIEKVKKQDPTGTVVQDNVGKSQDSYWLQKYVCVERPTHEIALQHAKSGKKGDFRVSKPDSFVSTVGHRHKPNFFLLV